VDGLRWSLGSTDGVLIGLLTAGSGRPLLLVHGGMGSIESWAPVWSSLTDRWTVTAMDRRGRATSGDASQYDADTERADIRAVAAVLASEWGGPIDIFAHSIGATFALEAAAGSDLFRRIALYEPAGPSTISPAQLEQITALIDAGSVGRAVMVFLTDIIGLSAEQVEVLRNSPGTGNVLTIAAATLPREGLALQHTDLLVARRIDRPVLLLVGDHSPAWGTQITTLLAATIPDAAIAVLAGHGHDAIEFAPDLLVDALARWFAGP
jgi:pimeloyl-ACP methyl ester carboxylesterase